MPVQMKQNASTFQIVSCQEHIGRLLASSHPGMHAAATISAIAYAVTITCVLAIQAASSLSFTLWCRWSQPPVAGRSAPSEARQPSLLKGSRPSSTLSATPCRHRHIMRTACISLEDACYVLRRHSAASLSETVQQSSRAHGMHARMSIDAAGIRIC